MSSVSPPARRLLTVAVLVGVGLVVVALVFVAVNAVVSGRAGLQSVPGADQNEVALEYTTEGGVGVNRSVVDSPLSISIRLPRTEDAQEEDPIAPIVASVSIQLFDEQRNPAKFGGTVGVPCVMRPTNETDVWTCSGSAPSRAGSYHARVVVEPRQSGDEAREAQPQRHVYEVTAPLLTVEAKSGPHSSNMNYCVIHV